MSKNLKQIWLINISTNRDVSISDLGITVIKGQRVNLLSKHYHLTQEQINQSIKSGSIYKKKKLLKIRETSSSKTVFAKTSSTIQITKPRLLVPLRHKIDTSIPVFDELEFEDDNFGQSDEQYAAEQAVAEMDEFEDE